MSGEFDTPSVPASKVEGVFEEFSSHLEQIGSLDHPETAFLGSTRSILKRLPSAPEEAGDLDLLVLAEDEEDTILDVRADLHEHFENEEIPHKHFFKNIFSVSFNNEVTEEPVQVDLVISERDPGRKMFRYLRDLKYYSSPSTRRDVEFEIKGLHRTELIRSFSRVFGLSMATKGFAVYVWAPDHDDLSGLMDRLEDKHSRTRKEKNLRLLEDLMDYMEKFSSLEEVRDELFDTSPLVKRKYLVNRAGVGSVSGKYAAKTLERELTNMRSLEHLDWALVLEDFVGLGEHSISSFFGTLGNLSRTRIPDFRVRHALLDYKNKLSSDGFWNEDLEEIVEDSFSVEVGS